MLTLSRGKLLSDKGFGRERSNYLSGVCAAIEWAISNNAGMISPPWSGLELECKCLPSRGTSCCCRENNGGLKPIYPAAYDTIPNWSNSGPELLAPDVGILPLNGGEEPGVGKSFSFPYVSGISPLLFQEEPILSPIDLRVAPAQEVDDLGYDEKQQGMVFCSFIHQVGWRAATTL